MSLGVVACFQTRVTVSIWGKKTFEGKEVMKLKAQVKSLTLAGRKVFQKKPHIKQLENFCVKYSSLRA